MIPDHIQRLIGGYATGTLSEKQRKLLFEAALEDQELFDELARDQALKELLEAPGVKQRLLASIETPAPRDWWRHPLPWLMGGSVLAISAGLMALVFLTPSGSRPAKPVEVAQAKPAVTAEGPSLPPDRTGPPKSQNEPKTATRVPPAEVEPVKKAPAEGAPAPQPAAAPPAAAPVTVQPQAAAGPPAPPPPPELQNEPKDAPAAVGQLTATEQQKTAGAPPPSAAPASRDAAPTPAPAPRPASPRAALASKAAGLFNNRFAFDYSIHDGVLRITPGSDGYLLVRANVGPIDRLILSTAHVVRATPAELRVPDGASFVVVLFSARPVQEDSTDNLAARATLRTEAAGTVEDPRPSVNSRLEVRIAVSGK